MPDYILDTTKRNELDSNIREMLKSGATQDDVVKYASDFGSMFGKKKDGTTASQVLPSPSPFVLETPQQKTQRHSNTAKSDAASLVTNYQSGIDQALQKRDQFGMIDMFSANQFAQSREGKAGKIVQDFQQTGTAKKEDVKYLNQVAPKAAAQIVFAGTPQDVKSKIEKTGKVDDKDIESFDLNHKTIVGDALLQNTAKSYKDFNNQQIAVLNTIPGFDPRMAADPASLDAFYKNLNVQKSKEIAAIEAKFPEKVVPSGIASVTYRENDKEYKSNLKAIQERYSKVYDAIGRVAASKISTADKDPLEIGLEYLKYADPDKFALRGMAGRSSADRDIAGVGNQLQIANAKDLNSVKNAKAQSETLDNRFPEKIVADTRRRLGAELYKDDNWFANLTPSVEKLDKAAEQLPQANRDAYYKFVRPVEERIVGTDIPQSGALNQFGSGIMSTVEGTNNFLSRMIGQRTDADVAKAALDAPFKTRFEAVGAGPQKARLNELVKKEKSGNILSTQEREEKADLETYTNVRSTTREIIDGSLNLAGQVVFQALGTKGLTGLGSAAVRSAGLLKAPVAAGLATEDLIAASAMDFGITVPQIANVAGAMVAYASSYDQAEQEGMQMYPNDPTKRKLYAKSVASLNALTERIFKDEKILDAFSREVRPKVGALVSQIASGSLTREALQPTIKSIVKDGFKILGNTQIENVKELTEEVATSIGTDLTKMILSPDKFDPNQMSENVASTATTMFVDGQLVALFAGVKNFRANKVGINMLSKIGTDKSFTADVKSVINAQVLSGELTNAQGKEKLNVVNTIESVNAVDMPKVNAVTKLSDSANKKYAVALANEKLLKQQLASSQDEALKSTIQDQIKSSEDFRKSILNKEIFIDDNFNVNTNATTESQVQVTGTEGGISQPQGTIQGQQEVGQGTGQQGQTTQQTANVGDSNIGSQGQVVSPELSNIESDTTDKRETIKQKFDFIKDEDFVEEAFTPEEDKRDRDTLPESGIASEQELSDLLADGEYAMLTGQNPDAVAVSKSANKTLNERAVQWLTERGLKAIPIFGKYGNSERSFLVPNMTKDQATEFANQFQQDSVAHSSGLVYKDGSYNPRLDGVSLEPRFDQGGDFFSSINIAGKPVDFSINYDFEQTIPAEGTNVSPSGIDKALASAIPNAAKALEKANIKFKVVDAATDTEGARAARGNQGLFVAEDGTIIIDKSKLQDEVEAGLVVWHEASHPVMNIIRNTNKPLYDAVVRGLKEAAGKNAGVAGALNWAQSQEQYDNADTQNDEAIVETIGRINSGLIDVASLDAGLRQKLTDFVNSIAKFFGIDPILNDTDIAAFKKTVSQVADALKTGRDISEIVGEENIKKFDAKSPQSRADSKKVAQDTEDRVIESATQPSMVLVGKKKGQDVVLYSGPASIESLRELKPKMYVSRAEDLAESHLVPGKVRSYNSNATQEQKLKWADKVYEQAKATVISNLNYIFDQIPESIRNISKLWYDGANIISQEFANKYGTTIEQAAAVIATQSPQKPWYDNVHLAHFIMDFYATKKNEVFTKEMFDYFELKSQPSKENPKGYPKQQQYLPILEKAIGKKFSELSNYDKSVMIRSEFDNKYERTAPLRVPTGDIVGRVSDMSSFSGYDTIAKGVSILEDGKEENISKNLGKAFKVRNFNNNISNPKMEGEVTIDTHAIAAAYMLPLGSSSDEVNFDAGTYAFFADAYRESARQKGVLARELQSIVWEGARALFPDTAKEESDKAKARAIWSNYKDGSLPLSDVQEQIKNNGKDLSNTDWARFSDTIFKGDGQRNYLEELPLAGRNKSATESGDGSIDSRGLPGMGGGSNATDQASVGNRNFIEESRLGKMMTDDGQGNYLFFHYSPNSFRKLNPNKFGSNLFTGRDERPGVPMSMLYTRPSDMESGIKWSNAYIAKVPKENVYPFNKDPLNFIDKAEVEFRKTYGKDAAFDFNKQIGFVTKIASEAGYPITVADWRIGSKKALRAQTAESLPVEYYQRIKPGTFNQIEENPKYVNLGDQASVGNRNLAPNGKPSNLNDQQYKQVRTPEFKAWFGDWENDPKNASKVVDENGEPMVYYHGTNIQEDFDKFSTGDGKRRYMFLSPDSEFASEYARAMNGRVIPAFVNARKVFNPSELSEESREQIFDIAERSFLKTLGWMNNPDDAAYDQAYNFVRNLVDAREDNWLYVESDSIQEFIKDKGYDAVYVRETGVNNIGVINPNQIKSATGNTGAFSTTDNRIQASVGNRDIFNKELPDSIINSVRASLRKKAPDSTTLQYLDELQQAKKDDNLLFEGPVNDMLENGVTLNDIASMLLDDEVFEDVIQVRNYFNNIGGPDGVGILTKASQASVGNRSEEDLRAGGTGKERKRALSSKFGDLDPETQAKIQDDATTYFQRPNKQTATAVNEFLDELDLIDAADYILGNPDIPEVSKVWMAAEIAKRLSPQIAAETDPATKEALTDKQSSIYNSFAKKATDLGQAVQAFIAFKKDPNAVEFFLPKLLGELKKKGAENITDIQKAEIATLLKEVSNAPEGLPKDKAIIKLSHYLGGIVPMKPMSVLQALWYAKILSGVTTQATNFFANVFNTAFELPAVSLRIAIKNGNPMALLAGIKGFGSGVAKGAVTAADIFKSGVRSKEVDKYFAESPLEYFTWSKWLGKTGKVMDNIPPINFGAWKYVGRLLAATDALFSTANQEAIANMLAYAEAAGTPAGNNFKKANQILGNTKQNIMDAKAQARAEGFDPNTVQGRRRVIEIVSQKRGEKITSEADAIGKRITMNYDPEGWTKPLFDATVALQQKFPPIKMVIPFARIVANLTENALNYSPFGLAKAATGIKNPIEGLKSDRLTGDERADMFLKFAIGMGTLAFAATKVGDDDDDLFEITASGSPDVQKKYELQKGGWRPYTITFKDGTKISYKDWPIAGMLAGLGHIRDAKKYSYDDTNAMKLAAYGFFLNMYDKSLLSGLQDFFGLFDAKAGRGKYAPDSKASERAQKYAAQQVKSVAISNLAQQTGRLYSELVTGDPQRDAKTFSEVIYKDLPIVNDGIRPIIDVFGDPVKYNTTERMKPIYTTESEEMIKWLNENKLFVGVPQRKNMYTADGQERPMTDDEYYEYRKIAGKGTRDMIKEFMEGIKYPDRQISEKTFDGAKDAARDIAYVTMLEKYGFK
jgi:hypothetical protein